MKTESKSIPNLVGVEVPTEVWAGIATDANENVTADVEHQQLGTEESPVQPTPSKEAKSASGIKKGKAIRLAYTKEQKEHLSKVNEVFSIAFNALLENEKIPTTQYSVHNAVIDLTAAINNGIEVYMPAVNRTHGSDQVKTGESLLLDSPQSLLLVVPVEAAMAGGMAISRFPSDTNRTAPVGNEGLVCINGNGRIGFILSLPKSKRPRLYATLVEPDSEGFINIPRAMSAINEHQSQWKTQDKLQKKIMEDGTNADANLILVRQLVNSGYNYQAACQLVTLRGDRIKSQELEKGDLNEIFKYAAQATTIRETLISVFGDGEDKTLKTKPFSLCICQQFEILKKANNNDPEVACRLLVDFLKSIRKQKMTEIKNAKRNSKIQGDTKDLQRVRILNDLFNRFVGKNGIEID